jgi:23S rRNA (uracil1939-C5)-methyltransferase
LVVELQVDRLVQGGDGLADLDGLKVFVRQAAPGERVRARVVERKRDYWVAEVVDILDPSPLRVSPRCPLFGVCGGCHLQHISYDGQLSAKRQMVDETLRRVGRLQVPLRDVIGAAGQWRYRNKTQYPVGVGVRIGFFERGSHRLVDVPECLLHPESFDRLRLAVRDAALAAGETGYDERTASGNLRHLVVRQSDPAERLLLTVVTRTRSIDRRLTAALAALEGLDGVIQNINPERTNRILGPEDVVLSGQNRLQQTILGRRFRVSSSSFFQVNPSQAETVCREVLRYIEPKGNEVLIDLFCGVGMLSLLVAPNVGRVIGIELDAGAVEDAVCNAEAMGVQNAQFICGDVAQAIDGVPKSDVVILDPPRKGCEPDTIRRIAGLRPHRVVYVSCNPATLARDLAAFRALGYAAREVTPVDMFPQTYHIEAVACLDNAKAAG